MILIIFIIASVTLDDKNAELKQFGVFVISHRLHIEKGSKI